jgi:hypothetical protein
VALSTFIEGDPNKRGYPGHVVSHEERRPCHPVLQGELLLRLIFLVEVNFF